MELSIQKIEYHSKIIETSCYPLNYFISIFSVNYSLKKLNCPFCYKKRDENLKKFNV